MDSIFLRPHDVRGEDGQIGHRLFISWWIRVESLLAQTPPSRPILGIYVLGLPQCWCSWPSLGLLETALQDQLLRLASAKVAWGSVRGPTWGAPLDVAAHRWVASSARAFVDDLGVGEEAPQTAGKSSSI